VRDRNGSASLESSERRVEARGGGDDEAGVTSAHMLFQWGRRQELGPENAKYLIWQGRKEENYSKHRDTDNNWVDGLRTPFQGCSDGWGLTGHGSRATQGMDASELGVTDQGVT
jgi:hypothetical protein